MVWLFCFLICISKCANLQAQELPKVDAPQSSFIIDSTIFRSSNKPVYTDPYELGESNFVPKLSQAVPLIPINYDSFLQNNSSSLKIKKSFEEVRNRGEGYFYYIFLCFLIGIFVLVKFDQTYIPNQIKAAINARYAREYFRDEYQLLERNNLITLVIAIISISLLLMGVFNQSISDLPLKNFYFVVFLVALFMISRGILLSLMFELGDKKQDYEFLSFHFFLFIKVFGLLFVPVVMGIYFNGIFSNSITFYIIMIFLALSLLLILIKQFLVAFQQGFSNTFHFVLYFCGVELIPALILSKILFDVEQ